MTKLLVFFHWSTQRGRTIGPSSFAVSYTISAWFYWFIKVVLLYISWHTSFIHTLRLLHTSHSSRTIHSSHILHSHHTYHTRHTHTHCTHWKFYSPRAFTLLSPSLSLSHTHTPHFTLITLNTHFTLITYITLITHITLNTHFTLITRCTRYTFYTHHNFYTHISHFAFISHFTLTTHNAHFTLISHYTPIPHFARITHLNTAYYTSLSGTIFGPYLPLLNVVPRFQEKSESSNTFSSHLILWLKIVNLVVKQAQKDVS